MKKNLLALLVLCMVSTLHAKVSFELGAKGYAGYNNVRIDNKLSTVKYDDLVMGASPTLNICFNKVFGLTMGVTDAWPIYTRSESGGVVYDNGFVQSRCAEGLFIFGGLIFMIPVNDNFRVKTTFNLSRFGYNRFETVNAPSNGNGLIHDWNIFTSFGYMGELGVLWLPVKFIGMEFGTQYQFFMASKDSTLPGSGYPIKVLSTNWSVRPYIALNLRFGWGL